MASTRKAIESALDGWKVREDYKASLERLLLELDEDGADALMMLLKEGRGAWALLPDSQPGVALFLGNALSGTIDALATLGWSVVVGDTEPRRLAFCAARSLARSTDPARIPVNHVQLDGKRLPFKGRSFDLVVQEGGSADRYPDLAHLARGEQVLIANNRLAYKRSTGRRGKFDKPGPFSWLRTALLPPAGERSLRGYRQLMGSRHRAYALYPHADEFSHVVSLDSPSPGLTIGPRERANRAKVLAKRLGLFPLLTPSFALISGGRGGSRMDRLLDALGERVGERAGELDVLVATRSNAAVALTGRGAESGAWAVHVPLNPSKRRQAEVHARILRDLSREQPGLPIPEFLFEGQIEGVYLTAERRVAGLSGTQITGDSVATGSMLADTSQALASMVTVEPDPFTAEDFERLITERVQRVQHLCGRKDTARAVGERLDALRSALIGRALPTVVYHADLRSKHLQVTTEGKLLGMLDWGTCETAFLPYVDLLHLVLHQRKQEEGCLPSAAWSALLSAGPRDHEREALDAYSSRLGLDTEYRRAIEEAYPLLVAGMAERNWDYSRPQWLHRQYGI